MQDIISHCVFCIDAAQSMMFIMIFKLSVMANDGRIAMILHKYLIQLYFFEIC